jgi:peptidoglycan/LPS O-acetylase OafA/YrhL
MNVHARRFPLFDALRGLAAIFIVTRHASDDAGALMPGSAVRPYMTVLGGCALAIFFVVSGFLLYRPFLAKRVAGEPRPGFVPYALGRFLRIAPAYWVALTVVTLWFTLPYVFTGRWPLFYGFLYIYDGLGLAGIGTAWSLCIEVAYYAFLPLFVLFAARLPGSTPAARLRSSGLAVAGLIVAGLVSRAILVEVLGGGRITADVVPVTYLDWLGAGMMLAVVSVWIERRGELLPRLLRPLDRFPGIAWAAAALVLVVTANVFDETTPGFGAGEKWATHLMYGLFAVAFVLPAVFGDQARGLVRRFMANRVILYIGLVSYGIFLWHLAVLGQLQRWHFDRVDFIHPYLTWTVAALLGATAIASVSYYALERPAMGLRRRILGRRADRPPGEALADPAPAGPLPAPTPAAPPAGRQSS